LHIGLNLPPKDNLRKEDKRSAPKVSFIRRFHCTHLSVFLYRMNTGASSNPCSLLAYQNRTKKASFSVRMSCLQKLICQHV